MADANLGGLISAFVINTNNGSLHYVHGEANREWAVMEATGDQILTFALPWGEEKGHFFGSHPALSSSGLLAVDSEKREVTIFDLATSQQKQNFVFAQPVALKVFSADGKRLLVFTTDQSVYLLDMAATSSSPEPALASNP